MGHEIETVDGIASFFAVRDPAWHQLGTIVSEAQTLDDALKLARLNYTVYKSDEPVIFRECQGSGLVAHHILADTYATYRVWPDGQVNGLGTVGPKYEIMQTREAGELVEAITDQRSDAIFETAGSLRKGRQYFMSIKLGEDFEFPGSGDKIETWLVVASSHDGSLATTVYISRIRVVCANTLSWSLKEATSLYRVKHTSGAKAKVHEAREALQLAWKGQAAFADQIDRLMHTKVTDDQFDKITKALFPVKDDMTAMLKESRLNRQQTLQDLYYASPTVGEWSGTAYGAWNAVSEYEQWLAPSRGKAGTQDRALAVATRNVFDVPSDLSDRALRLLPKATPVF